MARSSSVDTVEKFRFNVFVFNVGFDPITLAKNFTGFLRGGFSEVTLPRQVTTAMRYRENIDTAHSQRIAGLTEFEPITLKRGVTSNSDFFRWARSVHDATKLISTGIERDNGDPSAAPPSEDINYRRDVLLLVYGRGGAVNVEGIPGDLGLNRIVNVVGAATSGFGLTAFGDVKKAWLLHNCFVTSYKPGDSLSASEDGTKLIEELELTYESFEEISLEALASEAFNAITEVF